MDWLAVLKWLLLGAAAIALLGGVVMWALSWFLTHPD